MNYKVIKRLLDVLFAIVMLVMLSPLLVIVYLGCSFTTWSNGLFIQRRVGYMGRTFNLYKFKSMMDSIGCDTHTAINDGRITRFGRFIRRSKIDELPQLVNVLIGDMSFVGPRPDVVGYADQLCSEDFFLERVRPGITSPASLYFRDEELVLSSVIDKQGFNDSVIWPIKVAMNSEYSKRYSLVVDIKILLQTVGLIHYDKYEL